jgi:hypothetical protein
VLTGAGGTLVADHEVRLDSRRREYEAFGDLLNYLDWHAGGDAGAAGRNGHPFGLKIGRSGPDGKGSGRRAGGRR